ncbi:SxtJ family membrane protein [Gammaproteobacteria bacterium]|jgi:hypothetical protein|nr:SxtJ family membrane protein [Gammaproteobacteria bacterium]
MSEIKQNINIKQGSDKNFGYVFSFIFFFIGFFPLFFDGSLRLWSIGSGLVMISVTLLKPSLYKIPNYLWFKFGILLGRIVSPVVMAIIFFLIIFPTGLLLRLFRKDVLGLKFDRNKKTYWVLRDEPMQSMKNQF